MDLRASQRGLKTSQKWLGTSHWDRCTGGQNFSLIYRTLSPMGAAAQHDPILANWGKNFQNKLNKMPKGIMRSPIPLPCFFDEVSRDSRAAAQTGDEVLKNGEKFHPSIHLSIHPSIRPSIYEPVGGAEQSVGSRDVGYGIVGLNYGYGYGMA